MLAYRIKTVFHTCLAVASLFVLPIVTAAIDTDLMTMERIGDKARRLKEAAMMDLLTSAEAEFNAAPDQEAKFAIVYRRLGETDEIGGIKYARNNLLSLAIRAGNPRMVENFLSAVPDMNSESLFVWGYRQIYNIAHVVLDPIAYRHDTVALSTRLVIVDLVARKGADFNWKHPYMDVDIYENPPLSAGEPRGCHSQHINDLRARALLWGADPCLKGSSFGGLETDKNVYALALDQFNARMGEAFRPHPHTLKVMGEIAEERERAHRDLLEAA